MILHPRPILGQALLEPVLGPWTTAWQDCPPSACVSSCRFPQPALPLKASPIHLLPFLCCPLSEGCLFPLTPSLLGSILGSFLKKTQATVLGQELGLSVEAAIRFSLLSFKTRAEMGSSQSWYQSGVSVQSEQNSGKA